MITVGRGIDTIKGLASGVKGATVNPSTGVKPEQQQYFSGGVAEVASQIAAASGILGGGPPFPNELRNFASYNYIFTFGCLNNLEINFPDLTYRIKDPETVILKSGGGAGNGAATVYENAGKVEYYIDDVEIDTIIGFNPQTKHSNATGIKFKVTEPLSMGLFLQALQVASLRSGHKNYLMAPFVLSVEFQGYDGNGNAISAPGTRRIFPLKLVNIDFEVTEGGSVYNVQAIPWHEQALTNQIQSVKTDVTITGRTVQELLQAGGQSLMQHINRREQEKKKNKDVFTPDEFVILFPTKRDSATESLGGTQEKVDAATTNPNSSGGGPPGGEVTAEDKRRIFESISGTENAPIPVDFDAELAKLLGIVGDRSKIGKNVKEFAEKDENINEIGKSKLVKSFLDGGKQPFGRPKFVEVEGKPGVFSRGKVQVSNNLRSLTFKSGTNFQEMIEEIVILSEYGQKIATTEPDENGFIPWFRVEADVYNISDHEQMDQTGEYPKIYVYRVVPYKAHVSRYQPSTKSSPGIEMLKAQACKKYDYIYTGQNDDILEFDINFDVAFFTAITPFGGKNKKGNKDKDANQTAETTDEAEVRIANGDTSNLSSSGNVATRERQANSSGGRGAGGAGDLNSIKTSVARDFNDALVNSTVDLVTANMTIWGDPYYIADSGMGNYNAPETPLINITKDGTMDYQSSEVDIEINFRTPLDYGAGNWMDFPSVGTSPVGAFSGVYNVITCTNSFSGGTFTQQLKLIRRRNQPGEDTKVEATTEGNKVVEEKAKGSPALDAALSAESTTADSPPPEAAFGAGNFT